jgi:hypothetical protein
MEKSYLEINKPSDLKSLRNRALFKFFEIFPGFLSWGTLGAGLILSWVAPIVTAVFILVFDFYWLLRISYLALHQVTGYKQMKKNLKIDWLEKLNNLKINNQELAINSWKEIYHLIILPMYKEEIRIVKATCRALEESVYPKDRMIIVLTTEERAGEEAQKLAKEIEKEFSQKFFRFLITCHPKNIPGEVAGKGSNQAWGIKVAKEKIIDPFKIPSQNIILSGFDIDARPYTQYFTCLTYHYLTAKKPLKSSYQPVPVYNNNIWDAPAFSRVIASSGTFWQMMQQERPEQLVTYSAHSMPFKAVEEVGYPSDTVADDSRIFWKSYLYYDGDYRVIPLHYPISMDTVVAKNLLRTAINQYKQQRRWAWGCIEIPYTLYGFLKNKKIPLSEKLRHSFYLLEGFWSWATAALLIFFLGWLPLIIGGEEFNVSLLSYNLPRLTSNIMTTAMIGMIVAAIISLLLLPPRPSNYSKWRNVSMVFQWILLPLTLIGFGTLPALDAQARLILGKRLGFWVTEKVRK